MDENAKRIQREIAKDKIQIILASIALAVLIIMEFYIMINYKSNFMAMAVGILLMIVALFFLISAILDIALKSKDMEEQKYEEIYNAQKASYLVIKKSFDEMEQRLRVIEENSSLPAEDIINAQKAVAKVTISRSKENTDALMNSNDELINQLLAIKEKIENNNNIIIEKQQSMLKETNFDIQQKISALTSQISNIEGRIQSGIPVMQAQPMQMAVPPVYEQPAAPESNIEETTIEEPVVEDIDIDVPLEEAPVEDLGIDIDIPVEEEAPVENLGIDIDVPVEEEAPVEDLGIDIDIPVEEETTVEDLGIDIDVPVEEETPAEDLSIDIPIEEQESVADESIDLPSEEPVVEESVDLPSEEPVVAESVDLPSEEPVVAESIELPSEEPVAAEAIELTTEEPVTEDIGVDLDALLEEVGGPAEEEPVAEPEPAPVDESSDSEDVVIPDVGVDLSDPNRVMSAEEIEKLFASI